MAHLFSGHFQWPNAEPDGCLQLIAEQILPAVDSVIILDGGDQLIFDDIARLWAHFRPVPSNRLPASARAWRGSWGPSSPLPIFCRNLPRIVHQIGTGILAAHSNGSILTPPAAGSSTSTSTRALRWSLRPRPGTSGWLTGTTRTATGTATGRGYVNTAVGVWLAPIADCGHAVTPFRRRALGFHVTRVRAVGASSCHPLCHFIVCAGFPTRRALGWPGRAAPRGERRGPAAEPHSDASRQHQGQVREACSRRHRCQGDALRPSWRPRCLELPPDQAAGGGIQAAVQVLLVAHSSRRMFLVVLVIATAA